MDILSIQYNSLNLPDYVYFANGDRNTFLYDYSARYMDLALGRFTTMGPNGGEIIALAPMRTR